MVYERRPNSQHEYFYQSVRGPDGQTAKVYMGPASHPAIRYRAAEDAYARFRDTECKQQIKTEQELYREFERLFRKSTNAVRQLDYSSLRSRHAGGPERERDVMTAPNEFRIADPETDDIEKTREQLERLERRTNAGDLQASFKLRRMLLQHPEVYGHVGDMVACSLEALLQLMAPNDAATRESIRLKHFERSQMLAAEGHGTALERMLIDHMQLCFLQVTVTRLGLNGNLAPKGLRGDAKFWAARHDKAQKHFEEATTLLLEARKMMTKSPISD